MSKTHPEGIPEVAETHSQRNRRSVLSSLSVALATIISMGIIWGFVGKTLYVTRDEFSQREIHDAAEKTVVQQTLSRVEKLLARQESAFEKLSDSVQDIRIEMASRQHEAPSRK
jgi:uncharacterized protein HemX